MKIAVHYIETVKPQDETETEEILDILKLPTLRYGTAQFLGGFSHWINKTELKKMKKIREKYYDRSEMVWKEGFLIIGVEKRYLVPYAEV